MAVILKEKMAVEIVDSDCVRYLIVSSDQHALSSSIESFRVHFRRADNVTAQDVCATDMVLIIDNGLDEVDFLNLNKKLVKKPGQFRVAICLCHDHINRWNSVVDSVFLAKDEIEQSNIVNGLIESIELQGLVCVDFADIYSVFCNMQQSYFYQGTGEGQWRAIEAIDEGLGKRTFDCETAMMIVNTGLDFSLDEFEMAANYFSTKISADTCCVYAHRLVTDRLDTKQLKVMIFINE